MSFAHKDERGQALVLTVVCLIVMLGMSALVLDVGAWFRTDRQLQATADAAALAGAQDLPNDPDQAKNTALDYANENGGNVLASDIVVSSKYSANDIIKVKATKNDPGFFSRALGINTVNINAHATARVDSPLQALHVAPMVVSCAHELIQNCDGKGKPKFGASTEMEYDKMGAPGAFGMLNLDKSGGTPGAKEEADWILHGHNAYLPLGEYNSDPGAKFSSSNVRDALDARVGTVLLFPVFRTLTGEGQNAKYEIIGWIGFYLEKVVKVSGNSATLQGHFTEYIAQGILAQSGPGIPQSFGVKSIQLIE